MRIDYLNPMYYRAKKDSDVESSEGEAIDDGTAFYYNHRIACSYLYVLDELAALQADAEVVTTGRRTRGVRVDYTKVAPIPGDDDDDDDEDERPKKKAKKPEKKPAAKQSSKKKSRKDESEEEESAEESEEEESAEESEEEEKPKKKSKKKKQVDSDDDDE